MEQRNAKILRLLQQKRRISCLVVHQFLLRRIESCCKQISSTLEKTLDASAHEVNLDTMIIVAH